jgi:hypothetical protein
MTWMRMGEVTADRRVAVDGLTSVCVMAAEGRGVRSSDVAGFRLPVLGAVP